MAHYALLNQENIVVNVFVGKDEEELPEGINSWEEYYAPDGYSVKRTSYNTRGGVHYDPETNEPSSTQSKAFRKNYAGIGFTYDEEHDAFFETEPDYPSWILNQETFQWVAPVPMPDDGEAYAWDEEAGGWVAIPEDAVE